MNRFAQIRHDYLQEKQPERFQELQQSGGLNRHCEKIGEQAAVRKWDLVDQGMRDYEAEEVVIADLCQ